MDPTPASSDEPLVRGTAFLGLRAAASTLWGHEGAREVAHRLSPAVRTAVLEPIVMPSIWLPERYLIDFCRAVWEGPARQDEAAFRDYLGRAVYEGWGRFQRVLLAMVTPQMLASRAPGLWRRDHTHGELAVTFAGEAGEGSVVRLSNHPYVETEFSRLVISETFCQIMRMTRVKSVRERHTFEPPATVAIHLAWS